jgi:hypothetical protein
MKGQIVFKVGCDRKPSKKDLEMISQVLFCSLEYVEDDTAGEVRGVEPSSAPRSSSSPRRSADGSGIRTGSSSRYPSSSSCRPAGTTSPTPRSSPTSTPSAP